MKTEKPPIVVRSEEDRGNNFLIERLEAQRDADVAWFNTEYPIMYREEADEVGDFIDRGWVPPEQYKLNIQQAKKDGYKQGVKDQYEFQQIDLEQAKAEERARLKEEIKKRLLTDEERTAELNKLGEDATYGNGLRAVAQAQLDKILKTLES